MIGLPARVTANTTIANISSARIDDFIGIWGGYDWNQTGIPNWGSALWTIVSVYPDYVGEIAWFMLFSIPFIMMWITHADTVPAAVVGVFMALYIFWYIGEQYSGLAIAMIALAIAAVVWSVWMRRL